MRRKIALSATMAEILDAARTLWNFHCVYDDPGPADVIVGLGSYDMRVATRCAALFLGGFAPQIIFTGASGNWTAGLFATTEAEAFRDHAHQLGVPLDAVTVAYDTLVRAGFVDHLPKAG